MQSDETAAPTEIPTESVKKAIAAERRMRRSAGINTAFRAIKAEHASNRSHMEVLADRMIEFASSTPFLVVHAIIFVAWILWNIRGMPVPQFDPYPYGMLTTIVSLEAIFLSIFVLMTQSRESRIGELREELTLQVNLRIEEEMTKTLHLVAGLYARLGLKMADDPELRAMLEPLDPKRMERELVEQISASMPQFQLRKRKDIVAPTIPPAV
ncbi:MAG: hypothetical protein DMD72_06520 [Gemmatimonadetes bacterium]|nr:MAG: hypothetical protein DMD72_06520 [Gemmatimonadota bacterium]PYO80666.1 MAG: hypothetical protein DMD63_00350 [Gemmatimonadota bacterium]